MEVDIKAVQHAFVVVTDAPRQLDLITSQEAAPHPPPRTPLERTASRRFFPARCKVELASRDERAARLVTCAPGDEDELPATSRRDSLNDKIPPSLHRHSSLKAPLKVAFTRKRGEAGGLWLPPRFQSLNLF